MASFFKTLLTEGPQAAFNERTRIKTASEASSKAAVAAYLGDFTTAVDAIRTQNGDPNYISAYWHGDRGVAVQINVGLDAIRRNDQQALSDLIDLGLKPNLVLEYYYGAPVRTLLTAAIEQKNESAANLLIDKGASVTFEVDGKTPLDLAKQHLPKVAERIQDIIAARSQPTVKVQDPPSQ